MKGLARLLRLLALLVLLALAVLALAVFTEQGARTLLRAVEQLSPVEIDYAGGTLGAGLQLQSLRYAADAVRVELEDVSLDVLPGCLLRGAVCMRDLRVGSLHVRWSGGEWRQGALQADVRLQQSTVEVRSASIVEPELVLRETDSADADPGEPSILPAIALPLHLLVDDLQLLQPAWDVYGARYTQDQIGIQGQWQHSALQLDSLVIRKRELGTLSLHGKLEFRDSWPLEADVDVTLAQPLKYSDVLGTSFELSAAGDLATLALQLRSAANVAVAAEAQFNVLDPALPFSATLTATSADTLALSAIDGVADQLQDPQLQQVEVGFPLQLTARGTLQSQDFELRGTASGLGYQWLQISLLGQHDQEKLRITELSLQDAAGNNALRATGEIQLSQKHSWSLALATTGLDITPINEAVRGRLAGNLALAGEVEGERWQVRIVDVALQGRVNDMPATIHGFSGLDSAMRLAASNLNAELNGAQLSLQSPGDEAGPGRVHVQVADIGRWQAGSSGRVGLDAEISPDRKHIQLTGRLDNVQWSGVSFAHAALSGDYRPGAAHAFTLDTRVRDLVYGDLGFPEIQLSARGDEQRQSLTLVTAGEYQGEFTVAGTLQGEQWQGALAPTRLQTPMGEWVLPAAVALRGSRTAQQVTLAAHCWRHAHAQLCPGIWTLGASGDGSLDFDADLVLLAALLPPGVVLAGNVDGQLSARWAPHSAPRVLGSAQTGAVVITQHISEEETATFRWEQAEVSLAHTSSGLRLQLGVQRDKRKVVALDLLLPPDRKQAIAGAINIDRLQLAALQPFVPALSTLAGEISGGLSLAGTVDQPQGFGELQLTGGQLALQGNPTQLENLDINLDVQGAAAQIRGTGVLGGGELQLSGEVQADPALHLELAIEGSDHDILYPPSTQLQIAQSLQLTVQKGLLGLAGEVTVLNGQLKIEELPEGSVALSPYVIEVDADGRALREELPFDVRMNVLVHIADRFTVTSSTLQATLGGELRVQQRPGQPLQLFGNLDTVSGEFRAYQTRLRVKRGTLNFTGPPTNPTVDVRAERRISSDDVTVGVQVQGPLEDALELEIYSDPAMSQSNAMSYLIRGRSMDTGAGVDGTSAALSLASGVVNRSELVTELNRIPGLSQVEFGAQGSQTDTAATVSGYLGERLYLSYGVGLYEPVNVLTARFYLRSRLWLEVISSLENSVDLYYSFDID
ncbi:MAG: translocation/assembly module TamB domain-containing protein [Haliea sp.]|nr:translocation/assembly module TamB domain-containing protein [Haliea sp.]